MDLPKTLIFDFDGTIADTFAISMDILKQVLPKKYLNRLDFTKLAQYRNTSTRDLQGLIQLKMWHIPILIWKARREMKRRVAEMRPIPEIPETLKILHSMNVHMYVVSTNSKAVITSFLRLNGIMDYFTKVLATRDIFGKQHILSKLIVSEGLDIKNTYYVGDEVRDIEACNAAGIKCISATWGFNSREILVNRNTFKLVDNPMELIDIVR